MKVRLDIDEIAYMWLMTFKFIAECVLMLIAPLWIVPYLIYKKVKR